MVAGGMDSWPIVPFALCVIIPGVIACAGLILMLRDAGAYDTGRVHAAGVSLLGIGISALLILGTWNLVVSSAMLLQAQQSAFASTVAPTRE